MPNIRSQRVDSKGITIVASDGRVFRVTAKQITDNVASQTGTAAQKRTKTVAWMKQGIVAALGAEQIDPAGLTVSLTASNVPNQLEIMGS